MENIIIVSLNPCIDWQYQLPKFKLGEINRVNFDYQVGSGKGINVAVALKNLGLSPLVVGFNFTQLGEKITQRLDQHAIPHRFINIPGAVRVNIKMYDNATNTMTELNQPGTPVLPPHIAQLETALAELAHQDKMLVLSGSIPPGCPTDICARLVKLWPGKVFVDAEGEVLKAAINSKPYCIKPNLYELNKTFGQALTNPADIATFCQANIKSPHMTCVSMGEDGAVLVTPDGVVCAPAIKVEARGVQGAGDSMVAGLIWGTLAGHTGDALLKAGLAAAAASVKREGTELCKWEDFVKLLAR